MSKISERLLSLRKEKSLNQEEAARLSGIAFRTYRRYEAGECEPTASKLGQLADFFEVSVDYLIGRSDIR